MLVVIVVVDLWLGWSSIVADGDVDEMESIDDQMRNVLVFRLIGRMS